MKVKRYNDSHHKRDNLVVKDKPGKENKPFKVLRSVLFNLFLVVVVAVLFIIAWVNFMQRPLSSDQADFEYFEIKKGESTAEIGNRLAGVDLIRSKWAFYFAVRFSPGVLQAGHYKLSSSMDVGEIISKIRKGEVDAYSVTIPEGYRTLQIAKLLNEQEGIDVENFIEAAVGKEGTLFPDTYLFPKDYELSKIVREMTENFEKRTKDFDLSDEQLIIASIVEREAITDEERPKIAAVYLNRTEKNMLLQADPTIRYSLDSQKYLREKSVNFEFWQAITKADISSLSTPYNTYKQKGLPPAPICNPGLKSIEATINPEQNFSEYYYFFHDKNQQIHFSKTYNEHLEALSKFN